MARINFPLIIGILLQVIPAIGDDKAPDVIGKPQTQPAPVELIDHLLGLPADAPTWTARDATYVPPDDAPLFEILGFWLRDERDFGVWHPRMPSDAIRRRLLAACVEEPEYLAELVDYLPTSDEACATVKALLDKSTGERVLDKNARQTAHAWLMFHSSYFRAELISAAETNDPDPKSWPDGALAALARLDWKTAEPMLARRAAGNDSLAAWALGVLHRHAIDAADQPAQTSLREQLRRIVVDTKRPAEMRQLAIGPVLESEWEGKIDLAISLLGDPVFVSTPFARNPWMFGEETSDAFGEMIKRDPDRFVPLLAKMAGGSDEETAIAAVARLVDLPRADAMRALLPWLASPNWAKVTRLSLSTNGPRKILETLTVVDLPESVPVLSKMAETSEGDDLIAIALALNHQRADNAAAVVRKAIDAIDAINGWPALRPRSFDGQHSPECKLVQTAIQRGVLTDSQVIQFIDAYARYEAESFQRHGLFDPVAETHDARVGEALIEIPPTSPAVAAALLDEWAALRQTKPDVAGLLWDIVSTCPVDAVDRRILRCLDEQPLDPTIVITALKRSASMRRLFAKELRDMVHRRGEHGGLAAALLADIAVSQTVLDGADANAERMLLACARLARASLPLASAGRLLNSKDAKVAHAADRYLSCEESPEARGLVWAHHPGEVLILGADWGWYESDPPSYNEDGNSETALRNEMKQADAPDEIFAASNWAGLSSNFEQTIVRRRGTTATLEVQPWGTMEKSLTRAMTSAELRQVLEFVAVEHFDDLPQLTVNVVDGFLSEYLHLTHAGGRRVVMSNAGAAGSANSPHYALLLLFRHLANTGVFQTHYFSIENKYPRLRVVLSDPRQPVGALWKQGDQLFARIGGDQDPKTWHAFRNNSVAEAVAPPRDFVTTDPASSDDSPADIDPSDLERRWNAMAGDWLVFSAHPRSGDARTGLFRWQKGQPPQLIVDADVNNPVTTYDGQWAVASVDQGLVSVQIESGKLRHISLPADRQYAAVVFVPLVNKILVTGSRKNSDDSTDTKYWLINPAVATAEAVNGDFTPLLQSHGRMLPSKNHPDEVWLTASDHANGDPAGRYARIGRFNVRTFTWTEEFNLPRIYFNNDGIAVNEAEGTIDIAVNGDLLQLPLQLAAGAAPAAVAPLVLSIEGDDWGASKQDVDKVLHSAADQVFGYFPGRQLKPILVSRGRIVPITLFKKGPAGEYQVHLATGGTYWAQYTYQFAHELCHILANYDHHNTGKQQWFEESLCETSSLFVLSKMHKAWQVNPPYPNWKDWGIHFDEYLNGMLAERARRLPPDQTMSQWITALLPELVKEHRVTEHSKLVAAYLLPIFQDEPQGWESLNWLNMGEKDDELDFEAYLRAWRARVPEKHKAFVGKIQKLFGYLDK